MINSMYFNKEQFENGEMDKFIRQLNDMSYGKGNQQVQILIKPADCGAYIVEFVQIPWDHSYGGHFEYINEEHVVMLERQYPDGTFGQFFDEADYNQALEDWLLENPDWQQTNYGTFVTELDNDAAIQELLNMNNNINRHQDPLTGLDENGTLQ